MIRVLLADDVPLVRVGLRTVLCERTGIDIVGEAADGSAAVDICRRVKPNVVLMDIKMPVMNGIEALTRIRGPGGCPGVKVVMFTMFDHDDYLFAALRLGAAGFIVKDAAPSDIIAGVRAAHAGEAMISPSATVRLIEAFIDSSCGGSEPPEDLAILTYREAQVLQLVVTGLHNDEIAVRLGVSYSTVKSHIRHLHEKLACRDRLQLALYGIAHGVRRW